ncbi:MAG: hypothetical protein COZ75_07720 [Flavobacteriaceae bacterium CG_4_8_14_3_um_filter_34_10]|nr:hypothetical protein [Flavobacteriia bacterium]PIQ18748.1 MAG: hypothetical protein COW66_04830 [Flavobacteriaceae bacterium CG18_big_fil_WC_8_21_14_2_50_34_36]PIV48345.1 MAG: hypothetical protein COS19_14225 [Flavobacteriaceae bacterium CG02_land_8_20_14_3_00_34_13]PIX09258.1 MAG: hypothetical protein COZ75_07720 [Flavobacteriaceae bacterium CG_4_8_14_3_um_filter_34_10]PIZ07264.1 MAG: hypothetical protein COY56_09905 [Flavobacteriaceae bacterium CG_4_10_14_0_8_um_filter_34_31]PJC08187.1 MA
MRAALKYDFCEFSIFNNFIIAVINEGITVMPEHNEVLLKLAKKYFKNRPFAYITNRIHSYAVDPKVYLETSKIENLVAFAVVSQQKLSTSNTQVEKMFLNKPYKNFEHLLEAIHWSESIIATSSIKK